MISNGSRSLKRKRKLLLIYCTYMLNWVNHKEWIAWMSVFTQKKHCSYMICKLLFWYWWQDHCERITYIANLSNQKRVLSATKIVRHCQALLNFHPIFSSCHSAFLNFYDWGCNSSLETAVRWFYWHREIFQIDTKICFE